MLDEEAAKKRMAGLATEELRTIAEGRDHGYSPRAIELAVAELDERTSQAFAASSTIDDLYPPPPPEATGLGGWLLLPLIGLLGAALFQSGALLSQIRILFHLVRSTPTARLDVIALCLYYVIKRLLLGPGAIVILVLFLKRHRLTPRLMKTLYASLIGFAAIESVLLLVLSRSPAARDLVPLLNSPLRFLVISISSALIWIPYFSSSVRVRNTFTRPHFSSLDLTPNPSLQRTSPGRSPGFGR